MPLIAHVDANGVLERFEKVPKKRCRSGPGRVALPDVESCDLEPGRYRWDADAGAFVPVGHGYGKPTPPPIDGDRAVFLALRALVRGDPVPQEVESWLAWVEAEIEPRRKGAPPKPGA